MFLEVLRYVSTSQSKFKCKNVNRLGIYVAILSASTYTADQSSRSAPQLRQDIMQVSADRTAKLSTKRLKVQ